MNQITDKNKDTIEILIAIAKSLVEPNYILGAKVAAILAEANDKGETTILNVVIAGDARPIESHAEHLVCQANIPNGNKHFELVTTAIPCEYCAAAIIKTFVMKDKLVTVTLPKQLNVLSKWYKSQIRGLALLKANDVELRYYD